MTVPRDLPPQFDPGSVETTLYREWLDAGLFTADAKRSRRLGGDRDPLVIVMPPPNVTAVLHMGHGLNNTVQDVVVRWRRMCGDEALWPSAASLRTAASTPPRRRFTLAACCR